MLKPWGRDKLWDVLYINKNKSAKLIQEVGGSFPKTTYYTYLHISMCIKGHISQSVGRTLLN